jgi:SET and RING associated domain
MDADEDVAFYRQSDACNCFGHSYKGLQRALAPHAVEKGLTIWFPKLYDNADWHNVLSEDEETIFEHKKSDNDEFIRAYLSRPDRFKRLVFARVRGPLGDVMYRFKGFYEVDVDAIRATSIVTYRRKAKRVRTFAPKEQRP